MKNSCKYGADGGKKSKKISLQHGAVMQKYFKEHKLISNKSL